MKWLPLCLLVASCGQAFAQDASSFGWRILNGSTPVGRATTLKCSTGTSCSVSAGVATVTSTGGAGGGTPGGVSGNVQVNDGLGGFGAYAGASCSAGTYATATNASGALTCSTPPGTYTLPALTASALGGVKGTGTALACSGTDKVTGFDAAGTLLCAADQTSAPGSGYATIADEATALAQEATLNFIGPGVTCVDNAGAASTDCTIPGGGPDLSAEPFITKTASANLSNEFALGSLATALLINTTTTGVPTAYGGATCTNQFVTALSAVGAATCTTDTLASAQHANQGTTTQVLHGNAAGNPSWAAVTLTTDVTGVLPLANGGTSANLTAANGAVVYSSATAHAHSAVGTAGQVLLSGGAGAPTWGNGCLTLGTATGATTTVGPVTWTGTFNNLFIEYEITGYNGGTPVGRILVGAGSISTTAATNGTSAYEGVAGTLTNSLSIPGAPLAVTLSSIGRSGTMNIRGRSGALKRYEIEGQNGNASVSAASTTYRAVGNFSDLSTNLPLQRAQLTVYDTLSSTSASAQTFNTGTTITVIGCP